MGPKGVQEATLRGWAQPCRWAMQRSTVLLRQSEAVKGFFDIFPARAGQDRPDGITGSPSCPTTRDRAVRLISERLVNGRGRRAQLARVRLSPLAGASVARCARRLGGLPMGPLRPGRPPGIPPRGFPAPGARCGPVHLDWHSPLFRVVRVGAQNPFSAFFIDPQELQC